MANFWEVGTNLGMNPNSVVGQAFNSPLNTMIGGPIGTIQAFQPKAPTFNRPGMDEEENKQVAGQMEGLLRSPESYSKDIMKDTDKANQIQGQSQNQANEQQQLGGGGISGMTQAISDKAQKNFAKDQGRLQQQAKFQSQQMANQNTSAAASLSIALSDAQNHVNSQLNQLQLETNAATYRTVASIMSGAGSVVGVALGSAKPGNPPPTNEQLGFGTYGNGPGEISSIYNTNPNTAVNTSGEYNGANFGPGSTNNDYAPFNY